MDNKTIAAISTPLGVGGISIVRLSGEKSLEIALKIFSNKKFNTSTDISNIKITPRQLYLGNITTTNFTEKGMMVFFKKPYSYTGENVVEFQCHGGVVIAQGILEELLKNGASLASAGEFTKQAFLNGKLTLDEAEGVIDMINAESQSEVRAGYNLLQGNLSKEIKDMQNEITNMLAKIEVTLDYPEIDYEERTTKEILSELKQIEIKLNNIISTSSTGMLIKNGTRVVILGKPNVGKSSLLNAMLNYDRAIVTNIHGTTRDTIEETYQYKGVKFVIVDTAGVRDSDDFVERIGIEKSRSAVESADIVLFVVDGSAKLENEDFEILELIKDKKSLLLVNKTDLPQKAELDKLNMPNSLSISALNKKGINELKEKLYSLVLDDNVMQSSVIITNMRHLEVLNKSSDNLKTAIESIKSGFSLDLVSIDIQNLWLSLGEITGENNNEEVIDRIFKNFCVGK